MVDLKQAITRIRRSILFNAIAAVLLSGIFFILDYLFSSPLDLMLIMLLVVVYLPWVIAVIMAVAYQYGGAVALYKICRDGDPPQKQMLKAASILIIIDPLFNFASVIGMILVPRMFIKGRQLKFWYAALGLFLLAQLGGISEALLTIPLMFKIMPDSPLLPGSSPGFIDAIYWVLVVITVVLKFVIVAAWWTLYLSYADMDLSAKKEAKHKKR